MQNARGLWPHSKLGWWLLAIFAGVTLGAMVAGVLLFRSQAAAVQATEARTLESIAALKVKQISDWRDERRYDASIVAVSPLLRNTFESWLDRRAEQQTEDLRSTMRAYLHQARYTNAVLVDVQGQPLLLADPAQVAQLCDDTPAQVAEALVARTVIFGDIQRCGPAGDLQLQIVAPVLGATTEAPRGAVVFLIDPAGFLYPFLQTWPVPSQTAETLLVRREGDEVVFLNELRHRTDTALKLRMPVAQVNLPASIAASGEERTLIGQDYRGQEVLAVTRAVPGSGWFMVAKADTAELFAALTRTAFGFAAAVIGLVALTGALVGLVFNRQQSDSLRQLYDAQLARQQVLERFEALVQSSPDAILLTDAAGQIEEANPQAAALHRANVGELLGQNLAILIAPEEVAVLRHGYAAADAGNTARFEFSQTARTGHSVPVEASLNVAHLNGVKHYQVILRDISARKRAEAALRASEEKFRSLFTQLNAGIVVYDADAHIIYANPASTRLLGLTQAQLMGRAATNPAWRFVRNNGMRVSLAEQPANQVLASRQPLHDYLLGIVTSENARPRWVLVDAFPVMEGGQIHQVVVTFVDITERQLAQAERARLLRELQLKNKDLENVVYVASHDLRSPLVNIQGFGQRLQTDIKKIDAAVVESTDLDALRAVVAPLLAERIPMSLRYIAASATKMDALINGLLRLSRAGRATLNAVLLDMNQMMAAILTTHAFQLEKAAAQVQVDALPGCWGDADQINQVFSNLLDNAIKYRDPVRPLRIHISGAQNGHQVVYVVADTGIGIPPDHQEQIWEIFHRLDPDGPAPGEGLGLTLTRRIVERQNGRIWVESEPGIGSRFFVALPVDEHQSLLNM